MRKLNTIQKVGNLNIVQAIDKKENGNTNHLYRIEAIVSDDENIPYTLIQFQDGAKMILLLLQGLLIQIYWKLFVTV